MNITSKDIAGLVSGKPSRYSKYRAIPTEYNGVRYASKSEAARAAQLDLECQGSNIRSWWIGQPVFRLGVAENVYRADFLVVRGMDVWAEDVKGARTAKFNRDVKLWRRFGPCELRIIKGGKCVEVITPTRKDHSHD